MAFHPLPTRRSVTVVPGHEIRRVADGAADGFDVAILQVSDTGRSTYEHLGFRTVVQCVGHLDRASLETEEHAHPG